MSHKSSPQYEEFEKLVIELLSGNRLWIKNPISWFAYFRHFHPNPPTYVAWEVEKTARRYYKVFAAPNPELHGIWRRRYEIRIFTDRVVFFRGNKKLYTRVFTDLSEVLKHSLKHD